MLAPGIVRVECDGRPFICGVGVARRPEPAAIWDGVATDAMMFRFESDGFEVVNATTVRVGDWSVRASTPIHLSVDGSTGRARIVAREGGSLTVGESSAAFDAGR